MENLLKVGVIVAVIQIENKCVKMLLPNKKVVDILPEIFGEIKKWLQTSKDAPESGGYIIGRGIASIFIRYKESVSI